MCIYTVYMRYHYQKSISLIPYPLPHQLKSPTAEKNLIPPGCFVIDPHETRKWIVGWVKTCFSSPPSRKSVLSKNQNIKPIKSRKWALWGIFLSLTKQVYESRKWTRSVGWGESTEQLDREAQAHKRSYSWLQQKYTLQHWVKILYLTQKTTHPTS